MYFSCIIENTNKQYPVTKTTEILNAIDYGLGLKNTFI